MWIMGQNEKSLFDLKRFDGIHVVMDGREGTYQLIGMDKNGAEIPLAEYKSEERAKDVLLDILTNIDKPRYVMPIE